MLQFTEVIIVTILADQGEFSGFAITTILAIATAFVRSWEENIFQLPLDFPVFIRVRSAESQNSRIR